MKNLISLVTLLLLTVVSYAHVWEIRVNQAQNGTLTWYLQSYHPVGQCGIANSGLTINGVNYPLQSEHAGSIAGLSNNVFAVSGNRSRASYAIVQTPFLGTNLTVQPYSTNVCWAFLVGGSGNFTPPPPPVCTTCPITSWSNTTGTPNNNGTNCNTSDDFLPTTIKVDHLSCASITGNGKFNVVYDPSGANISYGPYNFSTGISTNVSINLPVGVSNSTQLSVTSSFPCSETHGLSIPGGSFAGVKETVPPNMTCPPNKNVDADNGQCSAFINVPQPSVTDNCQQPGNSLDFDGSNDYVEMPNSSSLNSYVGTGKLTIEFWVKPTSVSGNNTVIAHRNNGNSRGLVFEMIGSNKLACYVRASGWRAIALYLTPNTWQHVAVVADASSGIKGYINGVLATSKAFTAPFNQSNDVWRIGRNSQSTDPRYFKGGLDEMRIWNTARSESDIRASMNMELSGSESGLVGYYDMNQGVAGGNNTSPAINTLIDKTSNSNNGTLTNLSLNGSTSNWVGGSPGVNNITLVNDYNSSSNATDTYPVGTTVVTWTATDENGNTSSCTQNVVVTDNQNPTITAPANVNVNADAGQCAATNVTLGTPTTGDNCGVASTTNNAPSSYPVGTTTVTWTVTDVNGNSSTATQTVTVSDNQNPTITCPADVTVNADNGACASTNVTLGTPITGDNCGVATTTNNAPSSYPVGTTTVTWTVTDVHGNTATCTQDVIVIDNQNPTITCPADVTVNADNGVCAATNVSLGTPITGDNCGVATTTNNGPSSYPVGTTTITWTVTDVHGNTATCTQDVTVIDNQNPTIAAPADVTVNADAGQCAATNVSLGNPTTGDNCGVATTTNNALSSYPVGTTTVTWTVTDVHGNTTTATQDVTVVDNQNPTITCPADVTVNADNGACAATNVSLGTPTTGDNCGVASTTNNAPSSYPVGTTTVTWTVTDVHGNATTKTQEVIVVDNQAPIVATKTATVYLDAGGNGTITVADVDNGSTDNCGVASTSVSPSLFSCSDVGNATTTLTVTDIHGNSATGTAIVVVQDTVKPVISCPADVIVSCLTTPANTGVATATDACGIDTIIYSDASTYNSNPASANHYNYVITRTWTAIDKNDNSSSCTQTITVQQLKLTAAVSNVLCNGTATGSIDLTVQGGVGTLSYAWSNNATTEDVVNLTAGTYTVTVTDGAGCTATATYTVTEPTVLTASAISVSPNPTVAGQGMNTIYLGYGAQSVTLSSTASGGTTGYTYSWTPTTGVASPTAATTAVSPQVTTTYTLTITDANGCTQSVSKTIYVQDVVANNGKILVCHNGKTKKLPIQAVAAHLAHGDQLGACFKIQVSKTKVTCYGGSDGSIDATVVGGIAPFTYSWSTGDTTEDLTGLSKGTYTLTVTAANGVTTSKTVKVKQNKKIKTNATVTNVLCYGDSTGKIKLSPSGGTSPYSYAWADGPTTKNRNGLAPGTYSVIVTDTNGCTKYDTFMVTQPIAPITVTGTVTNVSCSGNYTGGIDISVTGGTGSYTYYWTKHNTYWYNWYWYWWWCSKRTKEDLTGISAGTYTVIVKDANGCTNSITFTVAPAPQISASISVNPSPTVTGHAPNTIYKGYGAQAVTLMASGTGGTGSYTYTWAQSNTLSSTNTASTIATPPSTRTYTVTVKDGNGCKKVKSQRITVVNVKYGNYFKVCYKSRNKWVKANRLAWYLSNGAILGNCMSRCKGCPEPEGDDLPELGDDEEQNLLSKFGVLKIYPNPSAGQFRIDLPNEVLGGEVVFRDIAGRVIKRQQFVENTMLQFDLSEVANGMYIVEVKNGQEVYRERITIKR